ncbi:hypothetical protein [Enterobacter cloacae complex sp. 309I3]|uniref:hypothetical protein n=1 Tax=Enterobacter cloacae complex sp. 309I3 TaxID=3395879 RepID=UPI003CED5707
MAKEKLEIPFEGNEQYYEGIRGFFISFICSILGVILYASLLGKLTLRNFNLNTFIVFLGCGALCLVILVLSFKRTNRVIVYFSDPTPRPRVAFVFLILSYIVVGTFCALLFDIPDIPDRPLTTGSRFGKHIKHLSLLEGV